MLKITSGILKATLLILVELVIIISAGSVAGYILGIDELYKWGYTAMALNTAIDLLFIGLALYIIVQVKYES
mgnify:CR=1 FL=1|tara:strand:+ start:353 stop:568 length:216 start_codon:yes stop_codon:yes gene_type:complete